MIAKFTFNYNGGFEKKENAVFQQGSIGVDSYQVFAPFLTTTQVYIKTKRNGDLEFSLWKQLDYNSIIGGWLKTATQDELLVDGEMKVVFKFNNLVSQETSLWVRKGTLIVPEMTTYEALRDYVENQEIRIDQIINGATDIAFDKTGTNLNSDFVEEAIKEVNTKSDANAQNIADMKDGTTTVKKAEQDKNGNDIFNTYETKSDATSKLALKADKTYVDTQDQALDDYFENEITKIKNGTTTVKKAEQDASGNVITATYETKADATSKLATKVDKTRTIIGLDLQDDILIGEFRTALGNATQSVAGLLSAEDKTHLDGLVALLENSDGDSVVDTIGEILAIFQNYPEGADLVTVLQGKVDKVAGKGLSTNDFTDALKNKLDAFQTADNYYNKAYIDNLSNMHGWEKTLLTPDGLIHGQTILTSELTSQDKLLFVCKQYKTDRPAVLVDTVELSGSDIETSLLLYFFMDVPYEPSISYPLFLVQSPSSVFQESTFSDVPDYTFKLWIYGFKATPQTASNVITDEVGVSVQDALDEVEARVDSVETFKNTTVPATYETKDDATSKLALKADLATVKEKDSEQDYRITTIEEAYRKSQNGELTATKFDTDNISLGKDVAPAPLQVKVDGGLLEAKQLVVNGDFSNGTTGWVLVGATGSVSGSIYSFTATEQYGRIYAETTNTYNSLLGDKYYYFTIAKSTISHQMSFATVLGGSFIRPFTVTTSYQVHSDIYTESVNRTGNRMALRDDRSSGWTQIDVKLLGIFNISTLIANKTYSPLYNKTFDTMSVAEIKAQMDLWVQNGTLPNDNVLAVGMNKRVRSVGKNLFDISDDGYTGFNFNASIDTNKISITTNNSNVATSYVQYTVKLKPFTTYNLSANSTRTGITGGGFIVYPEVISGLLLNLSSTLNPSGSFTTNNTGIINVLFYSKTSGTTIETATFSNIQLEQGSTATSYVPYANTDLYLQANKAGYKLPNGVADTVEYRNGKYYYVQRVQKYMLQASDIDSIANGTGVQYIRIGIDALSGAKAFTTSLDGQSFISGYPEKEGDLGTTSNLEYTHQVNTTILYLAFPLGTYATLAEAQTALAGTIIYYQLETPIETEILALGNAQGLAGGTTYIDDIMADSNLYTSKYDIENTAYPIKSLDRIVKINADGSQTELAVSSAVVAGDGLSFTHPSLVANDIVWIAYAYDVDNLFKSNTFVTYYDNPFIAVQPNGTPRRITFSVDNSGVVTISSVAV